MRFRSRHGRREKKDMSRLTSSAPRTLRTAALLLVALTGLLFTGPGAAPRAALAASQSYSWRNVFTGAGGGFVPGIVFNQSKPGLAFARMDIGGAYRWNPSTNTWTQLLNSISPDDWNLSGVESIATDPVDPNRLYIAAGTYTNNFTTQNGAILRSTDQGNTFQRTMLPFKLGGNMPGRSMGERLAIDPNLDSTLYFGARSGNGLWRSTDFGVTWSKVASFTAQATYVEKAGDNYLGDIDGVVWETFDKATGTAGHATQTIYAGIADKGNSIFRSTDGGATWAAVPGQPTGFLPHHGVLANGQLYVTYSNGAGPFDGTSGDVWKLTTATGAWTKISPVPSTDTANDYFGYGGLAVDAQHPSTIMVSALNSWWPDTIFWRSTDAGATWTKIWDWTSFPSRSLRYAQDISTAPWLNFGIPSSSAVPPVPSPKLGWMVGSMAIDPFNSDHFLYGTGATMYGSNDLTNWDKGTTFHISNASVGVEETSVQDLVSPPAGAPLISGLGDIGGFRHDDITKAPPTMFTQPIFTTTNSLDYAELTPNFLARVGSNSTSGAPNAGFTFDGGTSWFQANNQPSGASGGTIAAAANASRVVWAPSQAAVSFSTDNGNSWTASTGIAQGAQVRSDRVNPSKFYGLSGGTFTVSTNGGASFTASAATGLPATAKFRAVPGREGDIWIAGDPGGMWHSTDSGATFTHLANVTMADNIGFGKAAPGQTYPALYTSAVIGGIHGLFRSDDAGATWVRINDDQHQFATTSQAITGDPRIYGRVYVGTNGLGIEAGDIAGAQTADFGLSSSPASVSVAAGGSSTAAIGVAPSGGFSGSVTFSATGLPAGVTASFSPASSAIGTTLTLTAASTAAATTAPVVVTGTSGTLTRSTTINLTVTGAATPGFTLAATPASLTVATGASGTSSLAVTPSGGFSGSVTFAASGLPAGVTATFSPASSATGTTLTLAAASTATAGTSAIVITGTSGTLSRSATVNLTVTPVGNGGGGVTVTPVVNSNSAFFNDQSIKLANTASLTALSVTVVIQRTAGVSFNGQFNTVGSQITQTSTSTASTITATFTLGSGQTLGVGTNWQFDVQTNGSGTVHPTTGDTFTVTYTTGGASFTQTGHF
jgi:xyloglucan-specific exo-beta-1,4-glucanase